MENYVKALLYAYPFLERTIETYGQHVRNKARLSYDGQVATETLVQYLAEEILRKRRLEWLQTSLKEIIQSLSEKERFFIEVYFFGEWKKISRLKEALFQEKKRKNFGKTAMRAFREQTYGIIKELLNKKGVTKTLFFEELIKIEIIQYIYARLKKKSQEHSFKEKAIKET